MSYTTLTEYRPNRNFIRPGDPVKCRPPAGGVFRAHVTRILVHEQSGNIEIEVVRDGDHRQIRTLRPERVQRLAKSKHEAKA